MNTKYNLITILGPTASGKTTIAAHLAHELNTEIISADSRQVFRDMNLGTGKDYADYKIEQNTIPFHLIDILPAGETYNVYQFQRDFEISYLKIRENNQIPILCGGTGLYIQSVLNAYNLHEVPENETLRQELDKEPFENLVAKLASMKKLHATTDITDRPRLIRAIEIEEFRKHAHCSPLLKTISSLTFGIKFDRPTQKRRITERLKSRLHDGLIQEVQQLIDKGISIEKLISYGLEYKYITLFLADKLTYNEMFAKLEIAIHQFSKRQMTWFRKMEKEGIKIHWLDGHSTIAQKLEKIRTTLQSN